MPIIEAACPGCGQTLRGSSATVAAKARCTGCGTVFDLLPATRPRVPSPDPTLSRVARTQVRIDEFEPVTPRAAATPSGPAAPPDSPDRLPPPGEPVAEPSGRGRGRVRPPLRRKPPFVPAFVWGLVGGVAGVVALAAAAVVLLGLLIVVGVLIIASYQPPGAEDLKKAQGEWEHTQTTVRGKIRIRIQDDRVYSLDEKGKVYKPREGSKPYMRFLDVNPNTRPKSFVLELGDNHRFPCIYELGEGTLKVAMDRKEPGTPPTEFLPENTFVFFRK
jgi:uncharacterized protein (TIGR03067 family)